MPRLHIHRMLTDEKLHFIPAKNDIFYLALALVLGNRRMAEKLLALEFSGS